jgi:predicted permease
MASIGSILFSLALITFGLLVGYFFRNWLPLGIKQTEADITILRRRLQSAALLYVNPVAFGGAIWVLNINDIRIIALPFLGAFAIILGGFLAYLAARLNKLSRRQTGVFVICGSFTNIGSIGSLITFILLGEMAVALMPFYKLFETFIYYGIGFPFAKSMSGDVVGYEYSSSQLLSIFGDKFVIVSIASMGAGLMLNFMGVARPNFYATLNSILIPLGTLLLLISIGLAMHFGEMRGYLSEALIISIIKFIAVPISVYILGLLLGLGEIDGGLPLKVSIVLSSMPVAFTAMVPPTLYDLDIHLANTAWFVTTILLVIVVPALWLIL